MLGFRATQQPLATHFASTTESSETSHQLGNVYTALDPARLDRSNCLRVDVDAVSGNYAPPTRHHHGHSTGGSDALAFIPIEAAPGHQQVFRPPNPLVGSISGDRRIETLKISLRDQCGDR